MGFLIGSDGAYDTVANFERRILEWNDRPHLLHPIAT